jgi:cobalt-precorrin-5B (C1)-methyltransferase
MAQNVAHTHAAKSEQTLDTLSRWTLEKSGNRNLAERIALSNTARHAFDPLKQNAPAVIAYVAEQVCRSAARFSANKLHVRCTIFDYGGSVAVDTHPDWGEAGDEFIMWENLKSDRLLLRRMG